MTNRNIIAPWRHSINKALWFLFGIVLLAVSIGLIIDRVLNWRNMPVWISIPLIMVAPVVAYLSIPLILIPFGSSEHIKRAIKWFRSSFETLSSFNRAVAFIVAIPTVFVTIMLLTIVVLTVLQFLLSRLLFSEKALWYISIVVALLSHIYFGYKLVGPYVQTLTVSKPEDISELTNFLRPNFVRASVYFVMALVYFFANVEKFSNQTYLPFGWWINNRDVVGEALLTVVAFDAFLLVWRERNK